MREPWQQMSRFSFESKRTFHFIKYARLSTPFIPKLSGDIFLLTLGTASCSGELFDIFPVTATRPEKDCYFGKSFIQESGNVLSSAWPINKNSRFPFHLPHKHYT